MRVRRIKNNYMFNQKTDSYCMDLLKGKIEFLLSDYGVGETCKISTSMVKKILNVFIGELKTNLSFILKIVGIAILCSILKTDLTGASLLRGSWQDSCFAENTLTNVIPKS